jgi:hypothetical protein
MVSHDKNRLLLAKPASLKRKNMTVRLSINLNPQAVAKYSR